MTGIRGVFVVVEGADASGKSTQARRLAERLRGAGRTVVETFEPGSTMLGAAVRAVVLGNDRGPVDERAEALLMAADRAQHTTEVIRPALDAGADVVCDRYVPSSLVYQGVARRLGVDAVEALSRWATRGLEPDLVLVLDIDDDTAAARVQRARPHGEGRRGVPCRGAGRLPPLGRRPGLGGRRRQPVRGGGGAGRVGCGRHAPLRRRGGGG